MSNTHLTQAGILTNFGNPQRPAQPLVTLHNLQYLLPIPGSYLVSFLQCRLPSSSAGAFTTECTGNTSRGEGIGGCKDAFLLRATAYPQSVHVDDIFELIKILHFNYLLQKL
jgi:hypothetical protein